jgi:hypothetical protein
MIIEHLLKLMFGEAEKAQNSRGRRTTVVEQRTQLELWLEDSPSLKSLLQKVFPELYSKARQQTMRKYQLKDTLFPEAAPFDSAQLLVPDFLPK